MGNYYKRCSSIRCVPAKTTLSRAKAWQDKVGLSRVSNITALDRIGLPVYAGVRPRAKSDAVTYGKGLLAIDAQLGAYMEAIEFYFAEPSTQAVTIDWGSAKDVVGANRQADAILDFNPILNKRIDLDAPLLLALAENVSEQTECFVPAELVFHPAPPRLGQSLFGTSTNGLASGNSVLEASIHGLLEVIERDIWSFEMVNPNAYLVKNNSLPTIIRDIVERAQSAGLTFYIQYVPNYYGLAFFAVYLYEQGDLCAKFFNGGWGCHYDKGIALVRAVCEAAQSRLAMIQGARALAHDRRTPLAATDSQSFAGRVSTMLGKSKNTIAFSDIPNAQSNQNLQWQWEYLQGCLQMVSNKPICRVIYTPPQSALHVVRILVPSLEHFQLHGKRMGHRLKSAVVSLCPA